MRKSTSIVKLKTIMWTMVYLAINLPLVNAATINLIDKDNPLKGWHFDNGKEFKGASGGLTVVKGTHEPTLKLSGDFTKGGIYVQMLKKINYSGVDIISFEIKNPAGAKGITLRLIDNAQQCHQISLSLDGTKNWQQVVFPVKAFFEKKGTPDSLPIVKKYQSFGKKKDGKLREPIKKISFLYGTSKKGNIEFRNIKFILAAPKTEYANRELFSENFESNSLVKWPLTENVSIKSGNSFEGNQYLSISRSLADTGKRYISSRPFPVHPGTVLFSAAVSSDLISPDNSFMGCVSIQWLNSNNKVINKTELFNQFGKVNWEKQSKSVDVPNSAVKGQFTIEINKASGSFNVDDLSAKIISDNIVKKQPINKVIIYTDEVGNMPFPGEKIILHTDVLCKEPIPESGKGITWSVRDYWGNEITDSGKSLLPQVAEQNGNGLKYTTDIDISSLPVETGKYYELHVSIPIGNTKNYEEFRSFAVLPKAATQEYDPSEIPFTIRSFDNRISGYVHLANRLGHRTITTGAGYKKYPPYKASFSGTTELCKSLGADIIIPVSASIIERRKAWGGSTYNWTNMTVDIMRYGAINIITNPAVAHATKVFIGNEPPETEARAREVLPYYKTIYEVVKKERPDVEIIGTSVGPSEPYFKTGFGAYQDVYDFHTYEDYRRIPKIFAKYEEMFEKYGYRKPICSTELGLNSQGLPRSDVAATLIKKISIFFGCGGKHVSWYGIMYPDKNGKNFGGPRDTHNVFDCRFLKYSPKLDAIAYYNMLNGITNKKFVKKKNYGDLEAYLFANEANECFISMWNDKNTSMFSLPLAGVDSLELVRLDGSTETLHTQDSCVTLRVGTEPILLKFKQKSPALPAKLETASFNVTDIPETAAKGTTVNLNISGKNINTEDFNIKTPYGWKQSISEDKNGLQLQLTVPTTTAGRVGKVYIQYAPKGKICGEADVSIPLAPPLDIKLGLVPKSSTQDPSIIITLKNNGNVKQDAYWNVKITGQLSMKNGTYNLSAPEPSKAFFAKSTTGIERLNPGQSKQLTLPISNVDPLNIYKVKAQVSDLAGRSTVLERYVGGFAGAKKTNEKVKVDGILDETCWKNAVPVYLNEKRQVYCFKRINNNGIWTGTNDLSGKIIFSWDDDYFYFAVAGKDDSFNNPESGMNIWRQDGLQILVDPCRDKTVKSGKYDYSFAYGKNGPQAWCHLSASGKVSSGEVNSIKVGFDKTITQKGEFCYEIAIPWNQLDPFIPTDGADLGFALGMNEDDGNGRDSFMGWFSGISAKLLDLVGDVILQD